MLDSHFRGLSWRWISRWWAQHNNLRLLRLVGPPCDQYQTWCASTEPGRSITAGVPAVPVAGHERPPELVGDGPRGPADVDDVTGTVGDDPRDLTITRQPFQASRSRAGRRVRLRRGCRRRGRDGRSRTPVGRRRWTGGAARRRRFDGRVWSCANDWRQISTQRVGLFRGPGPAVAVLAEFGLHGVEGGHDDLARFFVERPVHPHPPGQRGGVEAVLGVLVAVVAGAAVAVDRVDRDLHQVRELGRVQPLGGGGEDLVHAVELVGPFGGERPRDHLGVVAGDPPGRERRQRRRQRSRAAAPTAPSPGPHRA